MNNSSITFVTGCAISQSNFYLTSNLDSLDTWDLFSKTFIYKHQSNEWVGIDLDGWKVISVAFFENSGVSSLLALEQDGDLGIFQENNNRLQKIRELDDSKIQGQFNRIRVIETFARNSPFARGIPPNRKKTKNGNEISKTMAKSWIKSPNGC